MCYAMPHVHLHLHRWEAGEDGAGICFGAAGGQGALNGEFLNGDVCKLVPNGPERAQLGILGICPKCPIGHFGHSPEMPNWAHLGPFGPNRAHLGPNGHPQMLP